jgi:hypothetical protein
MKAGHERLVRLMIEWLEWVLTLIPQRSFPIVCMDRHDEIGLQLTSDKEWVPSASVGSTVGQHSDEKEGFVSQKLRPLADKF